MRAVLRTLHGSSQIMARLKERIGDGAVLVNDERELEAALGDAELLLITDNLYTASLSQLLREKAPQLKWMQLLSAGYDAVAGHGVPPGVIVTNAGDAYAPAVATHAVALLLGVQRQFPAFLTSQMKHHWERGLGPRNTIPFGMTIAVIGFGHIGRAIARILKSLGATIIAVTRHGAPTPDADATAPMTALHAVLARADAVMIALSASAETRHLIGIQEFAAMKKSAVLVNIARGYIVDCVALAAALKEGQIAGAGIDVTEPEPLPSDHPLWDAPNLILTPHMAGASGAVTSERVAAVADANLARYLKGEPLLYRVAL